MHTCAHTALYKACEREQKCFNAKGKKELVKNFSYHKKQKLH